ncbi:hypothetical protein ACLB2K_010797 [Fragaria x ananassa]
MRLPPRRISTTIASSNNNAPKRKERESLLDAPHNPAKTLKLSHQAEPPGSSALASGHLLAGYLAHEFLTKGTLLGQLWDPTARSAAEEPPVEKSPDRREAEAEPQYEKLESCEEAKVGACVGHAPEGVGVDQIWRLLPGMEITILYNVGEGSSHHKNAEPSTSPPAHIPLPFSTLYPRSQVSLLPRRFEKTRPGAPPRASQAKTLPENRIQRKRRRTKRPAVYNSEEAAPQAEERGGGGGGLREGHTQPDVRHNPGAEPGDFRGQDEEESEREEETENWSVDAEVGWGIKASEYFEKHGIRNVVDENGDEIDWEGEVEDNWVKEINCLEWESFAFHPSPLIVFVFERYNRAAENWKALKELEKAVKVYWNAKDRLPPRSVKIDINIERDLAYALKVRECPQVLFLRGNRILYREKEIRTADELVAMIAHFYYNAKRPSWIDVKELTLPY